MNRNIWRWKGLNGLYKGQLPVTSYSSDQIECATHLWWTSNQQLTASYDDILWHLFGRIELQVESDDCIIQCPSMMIRAIFFYLILTKSPFFCQNCRFLRSKFQYTQILINIWKMYEFWVQKVKNCQNLCQ